MTRSRAAAPIPVLVMLAIGVVAFAPAAPTRMIDRRPGRPKVIQSANLFVDASGLIYATDHNAGLSIIEFAG